MGKDEDKRLVDLNAQGGNWDEAGEYVASLGRPHALFTNAVRYLRGLNQHGTTILTESEPYQLAVLMKSPSLRSVLYYAAAALRKNELSKIKQLDGFGLLRIFPPEELAAVLATTYLFRKTKKLCDPRIWETLSQEIQIQMEAGFHIGSAVPAIGTARGLLVGVVRYSALSLFAKQSAREFRAFRRELNEKEKLFDLQGELTRWGCEHLQIGSLLLQSFGMGIGCAKGLCSATIPEANGPEGQEMLAWYAARVWIQSLIEDEKAPPCFGPDSPFYVDGEKLADLQQRIDSIYEMGSSFDWIEKTKEDMPKSLFDKLAVPEPAAPSEPEKPEAAGEGEENTEII